MVIKRLFFGIKLIVQALFWIAQALYLIFRLVPKIPKQLGTSGCYKGTDTIVDC